MGAVAVSWLLFQPWVQKEALLTATLPCLPQLWALRDPLRCHPGLPSAGCCLALGLAQDRPGRVSGGPCPPPPPQATLSLHPLAWRAGWWAGCSCSTCCWQQRQEESRLQRGAVAGSLPLPWQLQGSHGCRQPPLPALASPAKGEAHGVGNGYL